MPSSRPPVLVSSMIAGTCAALLVMSAAPGLAATGGVEPLTAVKSLNGIGYKITDLGKWSACSTRATALVVRPWDANGDGKADPEPTGAPGGTLAMKAVAPVWNMYSSPVEPETLVMVGIALTDGQKLGGQFEQYFTKSGRYVYGAVCVADAGEAGNWMPTGAPLDKEGKLTAAWFVVDVTIKDAGNQASNSFGMAGDTPAFEGTAQADASAPGGQGSPGDGGRGEPGSSHPAGSWSGGAQNPGGQGGTPAGVGQPGSAPGASAGVNRTDGAVSARESAQPTLRAQRAGSGKAVDASGERRGAGGGSMIGWLIGGTLLAVAALAASYFLKRRNQGH